MPTPGENRCARWIARRRKGLRPHGKFQRKYCRRLGTSSCRRAFDTPSKRRQLPVSPSHNLRRRLTRRSRWRARNPRCVNHQVLVTVSQRLFQRIHFTSRSRKGDASRCRRISQSSQPPRRNAFAVRPMNLQRKFEPFVQRRRRRAFDSASKERRVNAGQPGLGFAFAEVRTRPALCNRIQLVEWCRRTLGTALASRTTRWKST